jgi:hypothetical protein
MRLSALGDVLAAGAGLPETAMSIRCLLGYHHRSRRHARDNGRGLVSKCERCGIPMEKDRKGAWIIERAESEPESLAD